MTFSFRVVGVSTHKMAYREETTTCLWSHFSDLSLNAALTKKRKISDTWEIICCADHLYMPYSFWVMHEWKESRKNKIKILMVDFLECEEDSWNSGSIFYMRIAKGFNLQELCITLLCLSWSFSHILSTERHFKPAQSLLRKYSTFWYKRHWWTH